jgi:hypothetical protein
VIRIAYLQLTYPENFFSEYILITEMHPVPISTASNPYLKRIMKVFEDLSPEEQEALTTTIEVAVNGK